MKAELRFLRRQCLYLSLLVLLLFSDLPARDTVGGALTEAESRVLKVCEGVLQLFEQFPDSAWPGYDLSKQPFIVYFPEEWALLFNYSKESDGFGAYSSDWPSIGENILYHDGQYRDLAGQLAFFVPVDTVKVAAVGYRGQPDKELFKYIVHEAFHQYQYDHFGEIPWEREQKYPIQDVENTALACLEMRLLSDALKASESGDRKRCIESVRQFVAVRNLRWNRGDSYIPEYEQGQEINEGTARYVESQCAALMSGVKYESSIADSSGPLPDEFRSASMQKIILADMQDRLTGNSISPEDMPRNRIYPVGSALGFLLDYLDIGWKEKAQLAGPTFTFAGLFKDNLDIDDSQFPQLIERAKKKYNYDEMLSSADSLVAQFTNEFDSALQSFESQPGLRMEIELNSNGVMRSRHSRSRKWVVDRGTRELCGKFGIYTLKTDDLHLQVKDSGLLEENDWEKLTKKVIFFVPEPVSISLDGESVEPVDGNEYTFGNIEMRAGNMKFSYSKAGTIVFADRKVKVNLIP